MQTDDKKWREDCLVSSIGRIKVWIQIVVSRLSSVCVKVSVILVHEAGGCVLNTMLPAADKCVGRGQREQLHVVGRGVALVLVFTSNGTRQKRGSHIYECVGVALVLQSHTLNVWGGARKSSWRGRGTGYR